MSRERIGISEKCELQDDHVKKLKNWLRYMAMDLNNLNLVKLANDIKVLGLSLLSLPVKMMLNSIQRWAKATWK